MARVRVCVNRLRPALNRAVAEFEQAGFDACGLSVLDVRPIDVSLHPAITELDRYQHVIVTSPEAANQFSQAVLARWPQWPLGLTVWCVGAATAAAIPDEAGVIRTAKHPGSRALIADLQAALEPSARCVVATAEGAGRQFECLQPQLTWPLDRLELFAVIPGEEVDMQSCLQQPYWIHGSANLLRACCDYAATHHVSLAGVTHCVTSDDAEALLPPGWRYYRIAAPQPEYVRLALEGEPCVKA